MQRRDFLTTSATLAALLGGCIGPEEGGFEDQIGTESFPSYNLPRYSDWVPADSRDESGVFFTHIDRETLDTLDEDGGGGAEDEEDVEDDDEEIAEIVEEIPIIGLPMYGAVLTPFALFGILFYPFTGDLLPEDEKEAVEGIETPSTPETSSPS